MKRSHSNYFLRSLCLIVLLTFGAQQSHAQENEADGSYFNIGALGGINKALYSGPLTYEGRNSTDTYNTSGTIGANFGATVRIPVVDKIALGLDLLYTINRTKIFYGGSIGTVTARNREFNIVPVVMYSPMRSLSFTTGIAIGIPSPSYASTDSSVSANTALVLGARYNLKYGISIGIRQALSIDALSGGGQHFTIKETVGSSNSTKYSKDFKMHSFQVVASYYFLKNKKAAPLPSTPPAEQPLVMETKSDEVLAAEAEAAKAIAAAKKATKEAEEAKAIAEQQKAEAEAEIAAAELAKNNSQEADIKYRGTGDPLKGLNVTKGDPVMKVGKYYAMIIGIDEYQGMWTPLNNAVSDAKAIETILKSKYQFDRFSTIFNGLATRSTIIKQFEWLVDNVTEDDNVFIYYSGHGDFRTKLNKGYWVPYDATTTSTSEFISNSDIQTFLGGINSKHTLLVADACFSGDLFRGNTVSVPFEDSEKYYRKMHDLPSRKVITSGGIEPVMDGGRDGHSVFAYYFIQSLEKNEGKYFDASQLFNNLKIPVTNNSDQTPNFQPIKNTGDEGGQFIFIKKP